MLFEKVIKEHILQGIKDYEEKGLPNGFGPSSTYDLVFEDKKYPPKAIMAYANFYAAGRKIEPYFKGGLDTDCFNAFERNGLKVVKKENKNMHEKLHKLKQEFLDYWPLEKLQSMTLEEYTDTNRENSFCYWLEHITRDLGSIVGGSSYKFGIYKRNSSSEVKEESNRTTAEEYAWFKKYGVKSKEEAFETVKSIIIKIANAA
jgi:5-methylcytosine-specific restriction protein B